MDASLVSPFFSLPRELRDRIYDFVLEGDYDCQESLFSGTLCFIITYGEYSSDENWQRFPRGLLACKQLLDEAVVQFHDHAVCTRIFDISTQLRRQHRCSVIQLHRLRKIDLREYYEALILPNPSMAPPSSGAVQTSTPNNWHKLRVLAGYLRSKENRLKDLTIKFAIRLEGDPRKIKLDLSFLEDVAKFDRVEFILEEPELDRGQESLPAFAHAYGLVQKELLRVAMSLMKASSDSETQITNFTVGDWLEEEEHEEHDCDDSTFWSVDHSWHLECRRDAKGNNYGILNNEGLPCWLEMEREVANQVCHFTRTRSADKGLITWYCELLNETISVPILQQN